MSIILPVIAYFWFVPKGKIPIRVSFVRRGVFVAGERGGGGYKAERWERGREGRGGGERQIQILLTRWATTVTHWFEKPATKAENIN